MNNKILELKSDASFNKFKKIFLLEFTKQLIKNSSHAEIIRLQTIVERQATQKELTKKEKIKERIRRKEIYERYDDELEDFSEMSRSIMKPSIGMFESTDTPESDSLTTPIKEEIQEKESPKEMRPKSFQEQLEIAKKQRISLKPALKEELRSPRIQRTPLQPQKATTQIQKQPIQQDPFKKIELWVPAPKLPPHIQYLKPTPTNKNIDLGKLNPLLNDPMVKTIECYGQNQNIKVKGNMGEKKTEIILNKEEIDGVIEKFSKETKIPIQEGVFRVVSGRLTLMAVISSEAETKFAITKLSPEAPPVFNR